MTDASSEPSEIWRWRLGGDLESRRDELAAEEPLEIRVRGRAICVTMRTPGHDVELAAGFLLSEGLIETGDDLQRIESCPRNLDDNVVNAFLAPHVEVDWDKLTRHVLSTSSCGLCGKASIDAIHRRLDPVRDEFETDANTLLSMPGRLRELQAVFDRTGGLHAAALFNAEGELLVVREDVGRHNAVDKVLGYALQNSLLPLYRTILLVSGRASFEIMQKALAGGIAVIAAVSAPSSLAVDFAVQSHQTLVGFLREDRMNVYAGRERINFNGQGDHPS